MNPPLPQLSNRSELAKLFHGECVELGVAGGAYSLMILRNAKLPSRLWSVDRWSDHHDVKQYKHAVEALSVFGARSGVLRMTFDEALPLFADESLGGIYFDGYAAFAQCDGKTLRDWWPKLKSGGIFSGHDYDPAWPRTIEAVDKFAADHGFEFQVTNGTDKYQSWYGIKS